MNDILYSTEEKDLLYLLVYSYLKYGKYKKAATIINNLPTYWSDLYLLKCLLYSQIMLDDYERARVIIKRLRSISQDIDQDEWFMIMQSSLVVRERRLKNNG